jgi:glycosyltransferase involved in cell wall biosynthesis
MNESHIVHVVCTDAFAGVERYVLNSALALRDAGFRVTVIGGAQSSLSSPLRLAGVDWLPGDSVRQSLRSLSQIRDVDLLNTHMTNADLVGALVGGVRRIPVVSTRHFASTRGSSSLARMVSAGIQRRVAAQIAISEFVASNIEGDSTVVYTGVDEAADTAAAPRRPEVLVIQRLEKEKATDQALRAWALVPNRGPWRLVTEVSAHRSKRLRRSCELQTALIFSDFRPMLVRCYDAHRSFSHRRHERASVLPSSRRWPVRFPSSRLVEGAISRVSVGSPVPPCLIPTIRLMPPSN